MKNMIAIVNVDKNVRKSGPHEYELRINKHVITRFAHNREEPLHECLMKAAIAAQEKAHKEICTALGLTESNVPLRRVKCKKQISKIESNSLRI